MANERTATIPLLRKVQLGRGLTNTELKAAIEFYTDLVNRLGMVTAIEGGYTFSERNARHELKRLKIFANNRGWVFGVDDGWQPKKDKT